LRRFGFPVLARRRYEGVAARIELRELHMERVHASCCGVNLAGLLRWVGVGFSGFPFWYGDGTKEFRPMMKLWEQAWNEVKLLAVG
jgi:hypothetical protein